MKRCSRDKLKIVYDILETAGGGSRKTDIICKARLSWELWKRYIEIIGCAGLIAYETDRQIYKITRKGKKFLRDYDELEELTILVSQSYKRLQDLLLPTKSSQ